MSVCNPVFSVSEPVTPGTLWAQFPAAQPSDAALGLLHGIAFGLFYAFMSVPLGLAVDRLSRKWVIFWGAVSWSVMTALCGLASGYVMLLFARIGVGIGEAALAPAGYSIIADTRCRRRAHNQSPKPSWIKTFIRLARRLAKRYA